MGSYGLYKVSVKSTDQVELVNYLSKALDLDVWSHAIPGHDGQVLVPKDKKPLFQNELTAAGVDILDLEDQLLSEAARKNNGSRLDSLPFDQIYTYHQVDTFLEMLAAAYPETVTLVNAGKSFEGRDIKYIKVSSGDFESSTEAICSFQSVDSYGEERTSTKPIVFMESLLHAREWITLPATLYAIHKLVIDVTEQDLIQDIDWIILPIANPDGYVHSHGEFRLWRKNRNTNLGVGCMGVDLNRNFDINWSEASSNVPCLDNYHGRGPFSEPEASAIKSVFDQYIDRIGLFLDIHSFGSMILYGYGNGILPPNGLMIHLLGVRMAESIDAVKMSWNPNYIVGNTAMVLYDASGTASDYAQSVGVPYSYTYELPGHRFGIGGFGFFVDPAFIEQAGFETWEVITASLEDEKFNDVNFKYFCSQFRLWRKNRNTNLGVGCMGVDLNRNFDINWSEASSNVPCLDTYHGRGPFSEPETSIIKSVFDQYVDRIGLFLDIHSFGSMILYGYGNGILPPNGLMIHLLGVRMAESIDAVKMSWNPNYIVGNVALVLYDASGSAGDYAQSVGVPYSYTYELPGHRFGIGGFGFFVDPAFIEQAGFETWEGIKTGARFIRDNIKKSNL
ncbi:hypothetical protein SFRURICE_001860 [Spodoptera frugiperda]|nr:hypothetical protein SFRURICE_001860 [Spodoptera frugiperda]